MRARTENVLYVFSTVFRRQVAGSSARKRVNKLPYGTARLAVHDTRIVQTILGSIQESGGFERPEWAD